MEERFETFTVLINRISRSMRRIKNQEMAEYGLRSYHISCLYYLYTTNGITATDLCEKCEEDKATVSRALNYLEKNGFLKCGSDKAKRYNSPFLLTEKGVEAGKKIADKVNRVLDEVGVGMSDEERAELYRFLSIISNSLEQIVNRLTEEKNDQE